MNMNMNMRYLLIILKNRIENFRNQINLHFKSTTWNI